MAFRYFTGEVMGSQTPRIFRQAQHRIGSFGEQALDLAATADHYLDDWQALILGEMLAYRDVWHYNSVLDKEMPTFAAREVGVVCVRQNGKSSAGEARAMAGLFLLGELLQIYSAHEFPTSKEIFERIAGRIESTPSLSARVRKIMDSHGQEGVYLKNGQRLLFKTRTGGGGRGFTVNGALHLDEAMTGLEAEKVAALAPTILSVPNAQMLYYASAGKKESTQLAAVRKRAEADNPMDDRLSYLEWSIDACDEFCPKDCREHHRQNILHPERMTPEELRRAEEELVESYRISNPALGIRVTLESLEANRLTMASAPELFAREHLGVGEWPSPSDAWSVIREEAWNARIVEVSQPQAPFVFAIDVAPEGRSAAIVAAGFNGEVVQNEEGEDVRQVHIEVTSDESDQDNPRYDHREGDHWVVNRVVALCKTYRPPAITLDAGAEAGALKEKIEGALRKIKVGVSGKTLADQVEIMTPNLRELCQATSAFYNAVVPRKGNTPYVVHLNQPMLTNAVAGATKREMSDLWKWSRKDAITDISPLVAATEAVWCLLRVEDAKKKKKSSMWMYYEDDDD